MSNTTIFSLLLPQALGHNIMGKSRRRGFKRPWAQIQPLLLTSCVILVNVMPSVSLICKIRVWRLPCTLQTQRCNSQLPRQGHVTAPGSGSAISRQPWAVGTSEAGSLESSPPSPRSHPSQDSRHPITKSDGEIQAQLLRPSAGHS